jgi:ATP synthase subunit 6
MTNYFFFNYSPVEQFMILPIIPIFNLISINNFFLLIFMIIIFLIIQLFVLFKNFHFNTSSYGLYVIPNRYQAVLEQIYKLILTLTKENINSPTAERFFPLIFCLFFFILNSNLFGLVPYSYTITSHLIVTFSLSLGVFIGINIICLKKHKEKFFKLFLPSGIDLVLAFLLVPIELISYVFKPISLSIRLFANMMAGHTLLKVVAGFSWILICSGTFVSLVFHIIPLLILIPLFVLEFAVAIIQSFVFCILICIYINDCLNFH